MAFTLTTAQKNTALTALATPFNNGSVKIYSGSVPADANAALGGAALLGSLPFSATAFAAAASGSITANAITQQNASATGTASFYRAFASDGTTVLCQGAISTSGAELNLNTTSITSGGPIQVTSYVISI